MFNEILFLDIETDRSGEKIYEIGVLCRERQYQSTSPKGIATFVQLCHQAQYVCGHNILEHDLPQIEEHSALYHELLRFEVIDTLPLSLLLFNERTHHALPKKYKNEDEFLSDPVKDCQLTQKLLENVIDQFLSLDSHLQEIFYSLLKDEKLFHGFFGYLLNHVELTKRDEKSLFASILSSHEKWIVDEDYLQKMLEDSRVELGYILALLTPNIESKAHPPKILYDYPNIVEHQQKLCYDPVRLSQELNAVSKEIFGFGTFRNFPKLNASLLGGNNISQRDIIEAALRKESFLAILPTGGGKTFTFWLPALLQASRYKSLTVVISPLQALIEDHIKSFEAKVANYKAVAISGFLTPQERNDAVESITNGTADILYIAPESLRSNSIFQLLKNRYIERFVVDEAHCLSTWGNDFRQDYYYICDFIHDLLDAKPFQHHIPVSCFTATGKPGVIADIKKYFGDGLGLELGEYLATPERKNLRYRALDTPRKNKYTALLTLITEHKGSSLVYIPTSTRQCDEVAEKLSLDTGKSVRAFHSKIDSQEKMEILRGYILNDIEVIVATTAFGMGVDKADITQVIHYEASDSLENYAQEAGRGARNEKLEAMCPILYDETDLDKHFQTLRRSKISVPEINTIFRVIKRHKGDRILMTAHELAEAAGWDPEESTEDIDTKIKTILLELEREGYIQRNRNRVQYFGDSVASDAREKLAIFLDNRKASDEERISYTLILNRLIKKGNDLSIEIDDIAYVLGIERDKVALALHEFKEAGIVGGGRDLALKLIENLSVLEKLLNIEEVIFDFLVHQTGDTISIKEINEALIGQGLTRENETDQIRKLIKKWKSKNLFAFKRIDRQRNVWYFQFEDTQKFHSFLTRRKELLYKIFNVLQKQCSEIKECTIETSLHDLKVLLENDQKAKKYSFREIDRALLFLHEFKLMHLQGGRFIYYAPMEIVKLDAMKRQNKIYTKQDYKNRLEPHYRVKTEGIHIMGEYANRLLKNPKDASRFLKDYFTLPYETFKRRYKLLKETITRPITRRRYQQIFAKLSGDQKRIIEDNQSQTMMILAGPGSGKTRVLVHKIASLVLMEDVKPEHFMMLTFSRSATREFRYRLYELIGEMAYEMEINTFHAYALNLIGRVADDNGEVLKHSIAEAARQIRAGKTMLPYRKALVLDEYQDIDKESFELVAAIVEAQPDIRLIAVGDDDQCIMGFNGADNHYFLAFKERFGEKRSDDDNTVPYSEYALLTNYRSTASIVRFSEAFIQQVSDRIKRAALQADRQEGMRVLVGNYQGKSLLYPTVEQVENWIDDGEKIAVLAYTNDMVLSVYSALRSLEIPAHYLVSESGKRFDVRDIDEVRYFDQTLQKFFRIGEPYTKENFEESLEKTSNHFQGSTNLFLLQKIVHRFLAQSERLSASAWMEWLEGLELDELENKNTQVIVTTIHKSKGLEFDRVILVAEKKVSTDENFRLYYVGMTRAKHQLAIFHHDQRVMQIPGQHADHVRIKPMIEKQNRLAVLLMGLSSIYLGFVGEQNRRDIVICAGDSLEFRRHTSKQVYQIFYGNVLVGQVSKRFQTQIEAYLNQGYIFSKVTVDYVVHWEEKKNNRTLKHVLAYIEMERSFY